MDPFPVCTARLLDPMVVERFPFEQQTHEATRLLRGWRDRVADYALHHPAEALFWVLVGGAYVFFAAEREVNEEVRTFNDALHYISTCLSVGYARIFPMTQTGKLVATVVMAIGPALTSWLIEGRLVAQGRPATPAPIDMQPVLERLDAILAELQARDGK
jgi:hypothetical protein